MKNLALKIIQLKLKIFAILYLKRYRPKIVAVTGSVGKSSCKEAIYTILRNHYRTRRSMGSYNNEIGVPLTIIGRESPGSNIFGWFLVFFRGFLGFFYQKNYPEVLVLEFGVDRPNDLDYLLGFVKPDIGVITRVASTHLEALGSLPEVFFEKAKLARSLKKGGVVILNFDDKRLRRLGIELKKKVIFYGLEKSAHIYASEISQNLNDISFNINWSGSSVPTVLHLLGKMQVYCALAACACAHELGVDLITSSKEIQAFKGLKGRMKKFQGKGGITIIDDTYNSNPASVVSAFETMKTLKEKGKFRRLVVVLGDMLELGRISKRAHLNVGREAAKIADVVIAIGSEAKNIFKSSKDELGKSSTWFKNSNLAKKKIIGFLKGGDLVLIKGSQGVRMERITKKLLKRESDVKRLPRMSGYWERR